MIKCFVLQHPQSSQDIDYDAAFDGPVRPVRIACGTSRVAGADLSEAGDFWPTYASWNSILFETSVILTVWEHADRLVGDDHVAFLHSDVEQDRGDRRAWEKVHAALDEAPDRAVGLTAPAAFRGLWRDGVIPDSIPLDPQHDPQLTHEFDHGVGVWDFIRKYDPSLFEWAMITQPRMVYAHQFAISRRSLDALGEHLHGVVNRLRLCDTGLWTPHMFERIIGLFLVRHGGPALHLSAFWHSQSSGRPVVGGHGLYGPRPFRYYRPERRSLGAGVGQG